MKRRKLCLLVDNQRAIEYACEAASVKTEKCEKTAKFLSLLLIPVSSKALKTHYMS